MGASKQHSRRREELFKSPGSRDRRAFKLSKVIPSADLLAMRGMGAAEEEGGSPLSPV